MKLEIIIMLAVSMMLINGCSNKQVYESIQGANQSQCKTLPSPQYEDCMENYDEPYESYKEALDDTVDQ